MGHWSARLFAGCSILALALSLSCNTQSSPSNRVKIAVLGFNPNAAAELAADVLPDFQQKTGISVELLPTLGSSAEQTELLGKLLARRPTKPDVYLIDIVWPGTLHEHLLDLSPYVDKESSRHLDVLIKNNTIDGRVVSLPFYMNIGTLFYRADLLRKYGVASPPTTWTDLTRLAQVIQRGERQAGKKDFWGYVWQGGRYEGLTCNALEWQASHGGGHIVESGGKVSVNNPQSIRALNMAAGWLGSISPSSVLSYNESDSLASFTAGNAAFLRYWSSGYRSIADGMRAGAVGIAPLPAGPGGRANVVGGFHLGVSRYSTKVKEAAALVLYLTSPEVQTRRALRRGYLPTYPHLYQRPEVMGALPQSDAIRQAGANAMVVRPSSVVGNRYGAVSQAYYESVHAILARKLRPEAGLAALETKLISLISGSASGPDHER